MTIRTSSLVGGGGIPRLAADLTYPSSKLTGLGSTIRLTGIDGTTGGLVTMLSLTGKYAINYLSISGGLVNESITLKLTVDGAVIWNDTYVTAATSAALITGGSGVTAPAERYACNSSFLLEITTITANNMQLDYSARPIL